MKDDVELSSRELAIAEKAAELAVQKMQDEFYQMVGKNVVNKFLIALGIFVVGVVIGLTKTWAILK